ncbi:GTPase-associated protein 1-related protein [Phytohabitans flavus]|uniref:GTPase-associated protein 1-related protein n=1 Tax=Phytohabitans flavus TaxID=1076124 RepID=UPI0039EBBA61
MAGRFGLPVPVAAVEPAVRRFVADWAEHPERGYRSELWPCRAEIEGLLRGELERRLAADPERVHELGDTWWQVLLRHPMRVENSLDAAAVSAAMRHLAVPYRLELVRECLESAMRAPDVAAALHRAAAGLWLSTPPTLPEAEVLAELAPPGLALDSMVFASLGRRLLDGMRPGDEDMAVARLLTGRRLWVPETNMEHMLVGGLGLDWVLNELARQNPDYVEITLTMPRIGMDAIAARAEPTIERLLETSVAAAAYAVLSAAPILTGRFAQQLYPKLRKNPQIPHVVIAFVLIHPRQIGPDMAKEVDDRSREELRAVVTTWVARCSDGRLEEAKAQVDLLGPQWMALWRELVRNTRRARGWRRLVPRPLR